MPLLLCLRFINAQHHTFLLELMKSVGQCYLVQGRACYFTLDLLQLYVPNLFGMESEVSTSSLQSDILATSVPDQFTHFLSDYVQRNALQDSILSEVETSRVREYVRMFVRHCDQPLWKTAVVHCVCILPPLLLTATSWPLMCLHVCFGDLCYSY